MGNVSEMREITYARQRMLEMESNPSVRLIFQRLGLRILLMNFEWIEGCDERIDEIIQGTGPRHLQLQEWSRQPPASLSFP